MDLIQQWQQNNATKLALRTPDTTYDWQQLDQVVESISQQLLSQGVTPQHIIAMITKNDVEAILVYLASLRIGALCALMPPQPMLAIQQKLAIIDADFVWVPKTLDIGNMEGIKQATLSIHIEPSNQKAAVQTSSHQAHSFDIEQYASVVFTSGSTGIPKAVVHAVKHHLASAHGLTQQFYFDSSDAWLLSLPIYHVSGLSIIWRWLAKGAVLVIGSGQLQEDIKNVTHASLVPIQLQRLLDLGQPISLKRVLLGGSHIPYELTQRASQQGVECWLGYGMTETASTVIAKPVDGTPSAGTLLPYRKIKLEQDRIYVAGDTLASGYLLNGHIRPLITKEFPWFDTKDLGQRYHQTGKPDEFIILGRADNQFISGGENIHCEEIEAVLLRHREIKQALVIPIEDKHYGQRPIAFLETKGLLDPLSYQEFLLCHLDKFKCPDAYYVLPKALMSSGIKISRADLKAYYKAKNEES